MLPFEPRVEECMEPFPPFEPEFMDERSVAVGGTGVFMNNLDFVIIGGGYNLDELYEEGVGIGGVGAGIAFRAEKLNDDSKMIRNRNVYFKKLKGEHATVICMRHDLYK